MNKFYQLKEFIANLAVVVNHHKILTCEHCALHFKFKATDSLCTNSLSQRVTCQQ